MKMAKVQVKYRLKGYPIKYRTKTMKMELPVDEYGFTLSKLLNKNLHNYLQQEDQNYDNIIWHRVVN